MSGDGEGPRAEGDPVRGVRRGQVLALQEVHGGLLHHRHRPQVHHGLGPLQQGATSTIQYQQTECCFAFNLKFCKVYDVNERELKLQLWDTGGEY